MNINPLTYISYIIFILHSFVPDDDISYRTRTDTRIKITINFIDNDWITDVDSGLFGT